jgi:hypothetical protein
MPTVADLLPLLGLRITAGPLELRGITDDDLVQLAELATQGIHDPAAMPFFFPWTDVPAEEPARTTAQSHGPTRAEFSVNAWAMNLGVWHEGTLVGV